MAALVRAVDPAEVRLHLELLALEPAAGRAAVLAAVRSGKVPPEADDALLHALERVGWGSASRALERIVADPGAARDARELALRLLAARDLEDGLDFGEEEGLALAAELAAGVVVAGDGGHALVALLEVSPEEVRAPTIVLVEEARVTERLPASAVWAAAAAVPWIALDHPLVLEALVREGTPQAERVLERAREDAEDRHRHALDGALMRLRTSRIDGGGEPLHAPPGLEAWVTASDATGAFQVLLAWHTRPERSSVLGVLVQAGRGVRDAGLFTDLDPDDAAELIEDVADRAGHLPAAVAPGWALALLDRAIERGGAPADVEPILQVAARLSSDRDSLGLPAPAAPPDERAVRALFNEGPLTSWHADAADLRSVGLALPKRGAPAAAVRDWAREASARAAGSRMIPRLVAALEQVAGWFQAVGRGGPAARLAAIAAQLDASPGESVLLTVLLERGARLPRSSTTRVAFGDDTLRSLIRGAFPGPPSRPRGVDIARLDVAEAALAALDQGFARVDASLRPRPGESIELALRIGERVVAEMRASGNAAGLAAWLAERLAARDLTPDEAEDVATTAARSIDWFLAAVCGRCATACWGKLGRPMARVWRSPIHPARG